MAPQVDPRGGGRAGRWVALLIFLVTAGGVAVGDLHLVVDRPVVLRLTSVDVVHSFFLPNFRVKQDAVPGRWTEVWFTPDRWGRTRPLPRSYAGWATIRCGPT